MIKLTKLENGKYLPKIINKYLFFSLEIEKTCYQIFYKVLKALKIISLAI